MARGTLHAAKPEGARRRRNAPTHDTKTYVRDEVERGPSLEDATGVADWGNVDDQVRAWWDDWRHAPQAVDFERTDWRRLALLAPIVASYCRKPSAAALSELRMNEERLGATVVDRMRARMVILDPEPSDGGAKVVSITSARDGIAARLQGEA